MPDEKNNKCYGYLSLFNISAVRGELLLQHTAGLIPEETVGRVLGVLGRITVGRPFFEKMSNHLTSYYPHLLHYFTQEKKPGEGQEEELGGKARAGRIENLVA